MNKMLKGEVKNEFENFTYFTSIENVMIHFIYPAWVESMKLLHLTICTDQCHNLQHLNVSILNISFHNNLADKFM